VGVSEEEGGKGTDEENARRIIRELEMAWNNVQLLDLVGGERFDGQGLGYEQEEQIRNPSRSG